MLFFWFFFSLFSGRPTKSLFRYFLVTLSCSGFRALWDLLLAPHKASYAAISQELWDEQGVCRDQQKLRTFSSGQTDLGSMCI